MLTRGIILLGSFFLVLGAIFMPVFPGKVNGLDFMDNLFNMISKGSSYFIPQLRDDISGLSDTNFAATVTVENDLDRQQMLHMLSLSGISATAKGSDIIMEGDLHQLLTSILEDADLIFSTNSAPTPEKYGFDQRLGLYHWWMLSKGISKDLKAQEKFAKVKILENVSKKAIEPAYNYFGIEPKHWRDNVLLIAAALCFYVLYTLWYGFGIMYIFEGIGLRVGH